jgi:methenyltetrahydromethanopterin cyclohydrolase
MAPQSADALKSWTGIAQQTAEQVTGRTQEAITNYFGWLQSTMSASPWSNTELNKELMSCATESFAAPFTFVQKLSQAKNLDDSTKIQTDTISTSE